MAITRMSNETDATFTYLPRAAAEAWGYTGDPLHMRTTHEGLVLSIGEYNGYDDSDFYAVVWNPETQRPERVTYATTRGWTYPNHAEPDATPETLEAYRIFCERARAEERERQARAEALTVRRGRRVRVNRGRKVPKGTEGECIWTGPGAYGPRCGIRDAAGNVHWTALTNVDVVA